MISNKNKFYFILLICIVILIASFFLIEKPKVKYFEYDAYIIKSEEYGFNADNDKIHFGSMYVNDSHVRKRWFTISNDFDKNCIVNILVEGPLAKSIFIDNNNFILNKSEQKELEMGLAISANEFPLGKYEGKVKFEYDCIK